ncbi:MAG: hypothetical protein R3B46_09560 [Phycisphaerales bacterium]
MKTQTTIASLLILAAGSIAAAGAGTLPAEFDEATPLSTACTPTSAA